MTGRPASVPAGAHDVIYDWNLAQGGAQAFTRPVAILDETLRDGLQSPSVADPNINDKLRLLHAMDEVGVRAADLGLPGAGPRAFMDVLDMVNEIERGALAIQPACAARTVDADVDAIREIAERTGRVVEVMAFVGSSPLRQFVEGWDLDRLRAWTRASVARGVAAGLPVTFVTEDTTRSHPDTLEVLFRCAIDAGAARICLCDTVGHATPDGTRALVRFALDVIDRAGAADRVHVDWHGHDDRGLGLTNTLYAIEAGATRVHGTALGVGERAGNAPLELILLNLHLLGVLPEGAGVEHLFSYCAIASDALRVPIPRTYPLVGRDAFRTATGVHAAAIRKAQQKGDVWLADRVYSGVPAGVFGRNQEIEVGHVSGAANVEAWLEARGIPHDPDLVAAVLRVAKRNPRILSEEEIRVAIADHLFRAGSAPGANPADASEA